MNGIQVTLYEMNATVLYPNTSARVQHLTGLQTLAVRVLATIPLEGIVVYTGITMDVRTLSHATFYALGPTGPFMEWWVFTEALAQEKARRASLRRYEKEQGEPG